MQLPIRDGCSPLHALMHKGFTSSKQPSEAYFSSFARATQYAIGLEPVFSLGWSIPPAFALHFQAVLLFQHAPPNHQSITVYARPLRGTLSNGIARLHFFTEWGLAVASSLAATRAISF